MVTYLLQVSGGDDETARNICMHVAAMRPQALKIDDLDRIIIVSLIGMMSIIITTTAAAGTEVIVQLVELLLK